MGPKIDLQFGPKIDPHLLLIKRMPDPVHKYEIKKQTSYKLCMSTSSLRLDCLQCSSRKAVKVFNHADTEFLTAVAALFKLPMTSLTC